MKKLILSIATLAVMGGLFAQETEINAAYSAFESNNTASAKAELSKVAGQIDSNLIKPESKAKYYFVAGQIALQEGNSLEAAKLFGELGKYENGIMYSVRNKSTKNTEYYATRAEAEKAAASGDYAKMKEESLKPNYTLLIQDKLATKAQGLLQQAQTAMDGGRDLEAGDRLLEASYLAKVIGGDADMLSYNAAISYHKGKDYQKAFELYKKLIENNYTGASSFWSAVEKASGNEISFKSKGDAELQQKLGVVSNVKEVKIPSVEQDLYTYTLGTLVELKKYDPIVEKIVAKYPKDTKIQGLAGSVYHLSGKEDMFLTKLIENAKANPNDPENYFNIGVLYMQKNRDNDALEYFEKAIKADPKYKNAYTNIALIKVKPEKEYIEVINANLGVSTKEKQVYKEYTGKRKALYLEALPYLEKAFELDKTDYESAKILRQAYQAAEMFDKEDQMRAIEKSLQ